MKENGLVLGMDIGGTHVRAALASGTRIVAEASSKWPSSLTPGEDVDFIATMALELADRSGSGQKLLAAGISLAAMVNSNGKVIQWPNRPSWAGFDFKSLLETKIDAPVAIEDDANAAALAECVYGAGRGYDHVLVIMAGTGVGAGLILNGNLFRGKNGWAGELGHTTILPEGPDCPCGKRGCLQSLASGRLLDRIASQRGLGSSSEVTDAANAGESWAVDIVSQCGYWIGLAAANVINLLDLDAVIVGGGLSKVGMLWWQSFKESFHKNLLNASYRSVDLRQAELPDKAGLWGAVALANRINIQAGEVHD